MKNTTTNSELKFPKARFTAKNEAGMIVELIAQARDYSMRPARTIDEAERLAQEQATYRGETLYVCDRGQEMSVCNP